MLAPTTGAVKAETPTAPPEPEAPEEEPVEIPEEPEMPEEAPEMPDAPELPEEAPELPEDVVAARTGGYPRGWADGTTAPRRHAVGDPQD